MSPYAQRVLREAQREIVDGEAAQIVARARVAQMLAAAGHRRPTQECPCLFGLHMRETTYGGW